MRLGIDLNAMIRVKSGRPQVNYILPIVHLIGARLSKSYIKVILSFLYQISAISRRSSLRFTVIFQKAQYVNQQQALGGSHLNDMTSLGCRFKRTSRGIPRIIPLIHRNRIKGGNTFLIQFWLSQFSLYRLFEFGYKLNLDSITKGNEAPETTSSLLPEFSEFISGIFLPNLRKLCQNDWLDLSFENRLMALHSLRVVPFFVSKSTPVSKESGLPSTSPQALMYCLCAWKSSPLLPVLMDYQKISSNDHVISWQKMGMLQAPNLVNQQSQGTLSKLGFKEEPAGKLRVFAMVDPITQWVLKPLHDKIFDILKEIPQDGTFDQEKPLWRLLKTKDPSSPLYSLDQSSATDRLPVVMAGVLTSGLLGSHFANLWMSQQTAREFKYSYKGEKGQVHYSVGQPMGALTSWSLGLALLHHSIIQFCAFKAGHRSWFTDYALLGDDIVIANTTVAYVYLDVLKSIGVKCSLHKSLVSPKGYALEFAKRFIYRNQNQSPVPLKEVLNFCRGYGPSIDLATKYNLGLPKFLACLGYGYKSLSLLSSPYSKLPKRLSFGIQSFRIFKIGSKVQDMSNLNESIQQSLFDSLKKDVVNSISDFDKTIPQLQTLIYADRTRAHYGVIEFEENIMMRLFTNLDRPLNKGEKLFIHFTLEWCYREIFLDTVIQVRDIRSSVDSMQFCKESFFKDYTELLSILDTMANIPRVVQNDTLRKVEKLSLRPHRIVRAWQKLQVG